MFRGANIIARYLPIVQSNEGKYLAIVGPYYLHTNNIGFLTLRQTKKKSLNECLRKLLAGGQSITGINCSNVLLFEHIPNTNKYRAKPSDSEKEYTMSEVLDMARAILKKGEWKQAIQKLDNPKQFRGFAGAEAGVLKHFNNKLFKKHLKDGVAPDENMDSYFLAIRRQYQKKPKEVIEAYNNALKGDPGPEISPLRSEAKSSSSSSQRRQAKPEPSSASLGKSLADYATSYLAPKPILRKQDQPETKKPKPERKVAFDSGLNTVHSAPAFSSSVERSPLGDMGVRIARTVDSPPETVMTYAKSKTKKKSPVRSLPPPSAPSMSPDQRKAMTSRGTQTPAPKKKAMVSRGTQTVRRSPPKKAIVRGASSPVTPPKKAKKAIVRGANTPIRALPAPPPPPPQPAPKKQTRAAIRRATSPEDLLSGKELVLYNKLRSPAKKAYMLEQKTRQEIRKQAKIKKEPVGQVAYSAIGVDRKKIMEEIARAARQRAQQKEQKHRIVVPASSSSSSSVCRAPVHDLLPNSEKSTTRSTMNRSDLMRVNEVDALIETLESDKTAIGLAREQLDILADYRSHSERYNVLRSQGIPRAMLLSYLYVTMTKDQIVTELRTRAATRVLERNDVSMYWKSKLLPKSELFALLVVLIWKLDEDMLMERLAAYVRYNPARGPRMRNIPTTNVERKSKRDFIAYCNQLTSSNLRVLLREFGENSAYARKDKLCAAVFQIYEEASSADRKAFRRLVESLTQIRRACKIDPESTKLLLQNKYPLTYDLSSPTEVCNRLIEAEITRQLTSRETEILREISLRGNDCDEASFYKLRKELRDYNQERRQYGLPPGCKGEKPTRIVNGRRTELHQNFYTKEDLCKCLGYQDVPDRTRGPSRTNARKGYVLGKYGDRKWRYPRDPAPRSIGRVLDRYR